MAQTQHVVLLGDSIFDNGAYVRGGPDVVVQLREELPADARATLLAIDGAVVSDVDRQIPGIPSDASFMVLSAGGNDALGEAHLLERRVGTVAEAVALLADAQRRFAMGYETLADQLVATLIPLAACTIYDANFPPPQGQIVTSALSLFNDAITRIVFARGLPLIDLRLICDAAEDYVNPIEPSVRGGAKIAAAIALAAAGGHRSRSVVWAG